MNQQAMLLRKIQEIEFACVDLQLFLDTHPDCKEATNDFNTFVKELNSAKEYYQSLFGPLSNFGNSYMENPNQWINGPWPWERILN